MKLQLVKIGDNEYRPDGVWYLTMHDYTEVEVNGKIRGFWDATRYSYNIAEYFKKDFNLPNHKCTIINEKEFDIYNRFSWKQKNTHEWKCIEVKIVDKIFKFWYVDEEMLMECLINYSSDLYANILFNLDHLGLIDSRISIIGMSSKTDIYYTLKNTSRIRFTLEQRGWGNYSVMEIDFEYFLTLNYDMLEDFQKHEISNNYPFLSKIFGKKLTEIEKNELSIEYFTYLITHKK